MLSFGRHVVGQVVQLLPSGDWDQQLDRSFLNRKLGDGHRVIHRIQPASEVQPSNDSKAASKALSEQCAT